MSMKRVAAERTKDEGANDTYTQPDAHLKKTAIKAAGNFV